MYFSLPGLALPPSVSWETGQGLISILCLGWQFATPQIKLWSFLDRLSTSNTLLYSENRSSPTGKRFRKNHQISGLRQATQTFTLFTKNWNFNKLSSQLKIPPKFWISNLNAFRMQNLVRMYATCLKLSHFNCKVWATNLNAKSNKSACNASKIQSLHSHHAQNCIPKA